MTDKNNTEWSFDKQGNQQRIREMLINEWLKGPQKNLDAVLWVMNNEDKDKMIRDTIEKICAIEDYSKDKLLKKIHSLYTSIKEEVEKENKKQQKEETKKSEEKEIKISEETVIEITELLTKAPWLREQLVKKVQKKETKSRENEPNTSSK